MSTTPCNENPTPTSWANPDASNRLINTSQAPGGVIYDAAGNMQYDGVNQYLYDGDGKVCAVASSPTPGMTVMTGYIYDADGQRVAKGTIAKWSCDPSVNGFQTINDYVLGPSGEQVTEMGMDANGNLVWQHTNVYAAGTLIATYDNDGLHFYLDDPLGTRRAQTDYAGVLEQTCSSLPFGDALACIPSSTNSSPNAGSLQYPTEHHFTGKERDTESGNDYFKYRYYASSMGRWLSPDPAGMMAADLDDPQSLNRYAYVQNNPLSFTDPLGLDCAYLNSSGGYDHMDQTISAGGCTNSGGYWVNGGLTNVQIDTQNNTISLTGTTNGTDTTTASYQIQTTADVGFFINDPVMNPAGHIAMGVGGGQMYGLGPSSPLTFAAGILGNQGLTQKVPGKIEKQEGGQLKKLVRVPITGPQSLALQEQILAAQTLPPDYGLYSSQFGNGPALDCATWVQEMLGDVGINTGPVDPRPESFINQLDAITPRQ